MRGRIKPVPEFDGRNSLDEDDGPKGPSAEELERLSKLGLKEMLVEARLGVIRQLLLKVQKHEATAAELAVLRNLLRDNGMILGMDANEAEGGGGPLQAMGFELPTINDDDDEE